MGEKELFVVFTNAVEGREDEFNQWYDEVHIPDVMKLDGVVSARRYELRSTERPELAPNPSTRRYVTIYEVERDGNLVLADLISRAGTPDLEISDAFDIMTSSMDAWVPLGVGEPG